MKFKFKAKLLISSLLIIILCIPISIYASNSYPSPTTYKYVNDYVGLLNNSEIEGIVSIGKELEDKTGAQAVVVIIDSTNNTPIEDYANNLFRQWGIGQKGKDNGLLILLAINDKAWRVEVGRGIEGVLPDALTNRIMESIAKPNFVEGAYGTGLLESYSSMSDYIATEYGVTLTKSLNITLPSTGNNSTSSNYTGYIVGGLLLLLILADTILNRGRVTSTLLQLIFISNITNRRNGPRGGGSGGGGFGGFGGGNSGGGGSSGRW